MHCDEMKRLQSEGKGGNKHDQPDSSTNQCKLASTEEPSKTVYSLRIRVNELELAIRQLGFIRWISRIIAVLLKAGSALL